ncbi:hypothetical protein [Rhizobium sp. CF122]|uniref:hypothetical protein n=1 Tax=Rhizobium sp. CF122 TaxID=1144312 RepID=UPI0002D769A3|nr:hypothetical protein [Rhizobium sp. CF122]
MARICRGQARPDFSHREIALPGILARALSTMPDVSLEQLTERERDVALLVDVDAPIRISRAF